MYISLWLQALFNAKTRFWPLFGPFRLNTGQVASAIAALACSPAHSAFMPACLMMSPHMACSVRISAANASMLSAPALKPEEFFLAQHGGLGAARATS